MCRSELLLGEESLEKLRSKHVLIAGVGGVGGYAAEALCRAGIGEISIVDSDVVNASNRNRQLLALNSTLGMPKTEVMAQRLMDINPDLKLYIHKVFLKDEVIPEVLGGEFDYVVDAIDTLSPKLFFIKTCMENGLPLVSSMGAGGRVDPSKIVVADISKTYNCTLAHVIRKRLRYMGIRKGFKAVYSTELVAKDSVVATNGEGNKKSIVGTISYMPAIFGLNAASVVIRSFIEK